MEEQLKFVYRKIDQPDIGIDGEIETLARDSSVTGGFVKVQVKTTTESLEGTRFKVPFDEAHLDYFDALTVPPILTVVSLADGAIWWKPILHKENYRGPRGGFGVPVDTTSDRLTTWSGRVLRMIAERSNAMIARYLIEEVEQKLTDIDDLEATGNYDFFTVDGWAETLKSVEKTMREASCLLKYERRYSDEITKIEERRDEASDRIAARKQWFKDVECEDLLTERRWGDED